jgi:hypothetical protein
VGRNKKEQMFTLAKQTKMERCPDCVCIQQDLLLFLQVHRSRIETYVKKKTLKRNKNVVALEMYTADWR